MCSATSFPIFPQVSGHGGTGFVPLQGYGSGTGRKAIEDNHRNPTPEGDRRAEMLRVPNPDNNGGRQDYRFDPAKINWEDLKKVGITADTLKTQRISTG